MPTPELDTSWLDDLENDEPPPAAAPSRENPSRQSTPARISFHCSHCGAAFEVSGSLAGRSAKCQKCGQPMRVPHQSEPKPAAPAPAPAPARATTHFANPLATPSRPRPQPAAAAAPPDDLLSELGFGVESIDKPAPAAGSPFRSYQSLGQTLAKPKRKQSESGIGWADFVFLGMCAVGLVIAAMTGFWRFVPVVPAFMGTLIIVMAGFVHREIALGLLSFLCGPGAYVIGWMKASEWNLTKVMIGWTLAIAAYFIIFTIDVIGGVQEAMQRSRTANAESPLTHEPIQNRSVPPAAAPALSNNPAGNSVAAMPPGWKMVEFPEADCRVALPVGKRRQFEQPTPDSAFDHMVMHATESQGGKVVHIFAYTDPPMLIDESSVQDALRLGRDGLSSTHRVMGDHPVQVAGKPGLWIDVAMKGDTGVFVMFVARGRLYNLSVDHAASASEHAYMQQFVDSFQFLTPESQLPPSGMHEDGSLVRSAPGRFQGPPDLSASPPPTSGDSAPSIERTRPMPEDEFAEALEELASDTPQFGLMTLSRMQPNDQRSKAIAAVLPLLTSSDESLRSSALEVLGVWGTEQELPAMIDLLDDSDTFVRYAALETVARFKTAAAAEAIAERLPHDKHQAEEALRSMGEVAAPAVVRFLQHPDQFTRMDACEILEEIGTADSARELYKLERDPSGLVVSAADQAIRAIRFRHKVDAPSAAGNSGRPSALRPVKPN